MLSSMFESLDPCDRLLLGFVAMIFFGHLVVAVCNWSVPHVLRGGILTLQLSLLCPNVLSVAASVALSARWAQVPRQSRSPPRTLSPNPSVLSLPLLDEELSPKGPKEPCLMSASYNCCRHCGDEELQSRRAIWILGIWRAILLGLLHAFQSVTNDFLVSLGRSNMEVASSALCSC